MIFRCVHKLKIKTVLQPFLTEPIEPLKNAAGDLGPGKGYEIKIPAKKIRIINVGFDRFNIEIK